jgi:PhoD-like phosphatase, N-terminal domain
MRNRRNDNAWALVLLPWALLLVSLLTEQSTEARDSDLTTSTDRHLRSLQENATAVSTLQQDIDLEAPFLHGVASGDPSESAISLWTRLTVQPTSMPLTVSWRMATDLYFHNLVANGSATVHADRDYTVQVDVDGLEPYTYYYYKFRFCDPSTNENENRCVDSITGRTKTAPSRDHHPSQQLRFATVSCARYTAGFFTPTIALQSGTTLMPSSILGTTFMKNTKTIHPSDPANPSRTPSPWTTIDVALVSTDSIQP